MRTIKFRAWDKDMNTMQSFEAILLKDEEFKVGVWNYEETDIVQEHDFELMQFTGLLDKNGKEIYEGDILWNGDWIEDAHAYNDLGNSVVQWDSSKWFCGFNGINGEAIEVIGNIYENPELLTSHT